MLMIITPTLRRGLLLAASCCSLVPALLAGPWEPLFNGKDFTGWKPLNGTAPYAVVDGAIVGTTVAGSPNSFLATEKIYGDFIFECEMMQDVGPSNSGVQFRGLSTAEYNNGRVHGYQMEIESSARAWAGGIYDEARKGWFYPVTLNPSAHSAYQFGRWNRIRIEAIGSTIRTWINGIPVSYVVDNQTAAGFFALQVHSINNPADAGRRNHWRNLRVQTTDLQPSPSDGLFVRNLIPNHVSAEEQAQGWRLLWDGQSTKGWRSAKGGAVPASWEVKEGVLTVLGTPSGADLATDEVFGAFELQLEFRLTEGANSGVKYYATNANGSSLGLEYQLLDDAKHPDAKLGSGGNRTLGSLYDLIPRGRMPGGLAVIPRIGEWQHARIVARPDKRVEHWLNGIKVVEFDRSSPLFASLVGRSKFAKEEAFGQAEQGVILLQDHGDRVDFRSIKVRPLAR